VVNAKENASTVLFNQFLATSFHRCAETIIVDRQKCWLFWKNKQISNWDDFRCLSWYQCIFFI